MTLWTTIRRSQRLRRLHPVRLSLAVFLLPAWVVGACVEAAAQAGPTVLEQHHRALALPEKDLPDGFVGFPFNTSITAIGGSGVYSILADGDIPAGIVLVRHGGLLAVIGVPRTSGDFEIRVGVTDIGEGSSMSRTYKLHIGPQLLRPDLATATVSDVETFHVTDADSVFFPAKILDAEAFHFTDADNVFKPIAVIDNEAFHFTDVNSVFGPDKPADGEAFHFGDSAVIKLGLMVGDPELFHFTDATTIVTKIGVNPAIAPTGTYNVPYSQTFTAVGNTGAATLTLKSNSVLPTGITSTGSGSSRTLSGTPTQAGTFAFAYTAQDTVNTTTVNYSLVIAKASQIITFPQPPTPVTYTPGGGATLTATSSAGASYPVTYSVSGPATLSGSAVTYTGPGTVIITANQAGDANYAAAQPVSDTVIVQPPPTSVFIANGNGTVSHLVGTGSSPTTPAAGGGTGVAVDSAGYVWSINASGSSLSKISSTGVLTSTASPAGLSGATSIAIDGNSDLWITSGSGLITELSNAGVPISQTSGSTTTAPGSIVIDISGNVWVTNAAANTVDEVIGAAVPVQPASTAVQNGTPAGKP